MCKCCEAEWSSLNENDCCVHCFNEYQSTDFKYCPGCLNPTDLKDFLEEDNCCYKCQNKTNDKFCISCQHKTVPSNFIDYEHLCQQCYETVCIKCKQKPMVDRNMCRDCVKM